MKTALECTDYFLGGTNWIKLDTDKYDTQFYIEKTDSGEVVIAFKDSDSSIDWINNFLFFKVVYTNTDTPFTAHSGFVRCWKEVRNYVENKVRELNPKSITVTGWSYGGAISVLCAEDMKYCFPDIKVSMITLGAPMVLGWKNWKKIKNRWEGAVQYRNGSDIVTCVPFLVMLFHHVVKRTQIGDKPTLKGLFNSEYHLISNYKKSLEQIKE